MTALRQRATGALAMTALVAALGAGVTAPAQAAPAPVGNLASSSCPAAIQQGQTSGCVTRLQNLLNAKQGARLAVDGVFGKATTAAVKQWQAAHHLAVDGVVGRATKASIDPTSAPAPAPKGSHNAAVLAAVSQVMAGKHYPYVWGGGHGSTPGPTKGGMDCSGFTRWVYSKAYGRDVLGSGSAKSQTYKGTITSNPQPGDLVYFSRAGQGVHSAYHTAIYLGNGRIAQEFHTGTVMQYNTITMSKRSTDKVYYMHMQ